MHVTLGSRVYYNPGQWFPIIGTSPENVLEQLGLQPDDALVEVAQQAGPFTIYRVLISRTQRSKEKPQLKDLVIQNICNWGGLDYYYNERQVLSDLRKLAKVHP
jgi:hypothetical protein